LYADMGHFGARPIRRAWSWLVFPSLVLNYSGQAALVLEGAPTHDNIFYRLCPQALLVPLVLLATVATIIASQSIITGAFSMTRQAIQLGWLPRLQITQTSAEGYGQIYVGIVNWMLMIVTVGLTIGFGKSDRLASAYGIAVSATMLATSALLFIAMREVWRWNFWKAGLVAGTFMVIDAAFFTANLSKIVEGGYLPITLAILVYAIMFAWHRGTEAVSAQIKEGAVPIDAFMSDVAQKNVPRVAGTAVFLTRTEQDTPPVMVWHVRQNKALHQRLFIVKVGTKSVPWVKSSERLTFQEIAPNVWRASAYFGFMEHPDIPKLLKRAHEDGCGVDLEDVTYYVGHETIIPRNDKEAVAGWIEAAFAFMQRNSLHLGDYFRLPPDAVVEIGRQVAI
jgi:KUP system potassium uptake protein